MSDELEKRIFELSELNDAAAEQYRELKEECDEWIENTTVAREAHRKCRDRCTALETATHELCAAIRLGFPDYGRIDQLCRKMSLLLIEPRVKADTGEVE